MAIYMALGLSYNKNKVLNGSLPSNSLVMAAKMSFSRSYMVLKPEELGFFDPIAILISSDLEKRKFVESSHREEEDFGRRWIIFVSILVQKFLLFVAKPMLIIGSMIESFLNLLSSNQNVGVLLLNLFRGYLVSLYLNYLFVIF